MLQKYVSMLKTQYKQEPIHNWFQAKHLQWLQFKKKLYNHVYAIQPLYVQTVAPNMNRII